MLSEEQVRHIRRTWKIANEQSEAFAAKFYDILFHQAPSLRPLFPKELDGQRRKLVAALGMVVGSLGDESTRASLMALGRRHVGYGAKPEHYPVACQAMLWALREACGEAWDKDSDDAWEVALDLVSRAMLEGAGEPPPVVAA